MELLTRFFNAVPKYRLSDELERQEAEFQVDEIYSVPEVGVVLGGTLTRYIYTTSNTNDKCV